MNYKDLYSNSELSNALRNSYREESNVFAYIFIKMILLNDYTSFLKWCDKNNNDVIFKFNNDNPKKKRNFYLYIKEHHDRKDLQQNLTIQKELLIELLDNVKNKDLAFVISTLRLSVIDLVI